MKSPSRTVLVVTSLAAAVLLLASACVPQAGVITPAGGGGPAPANPAAPAGGGVPAAANPAAPAQLPGQPTGITVFGQGSAFAAADTAELVFGVSARAATVTEAQNDASTRMSQIMESLASQGIPREQVSTVRYTVFAQQRENQIVTGYEVQNIIRTKVKAIDRIGAILDAVVIAGANQVEQVTLTLEDPKPVAARAREAAMADARAKADQLARLAGVTLGQPSAIVDNTVSAPPSPKFAMGGFEGAQIAPPISGGQTEVIVNVQVSYAIQ